MISLGKEKRWLKEKSALNLISTVRNLVRWLAQDPGIPEVIYYILPSTLNSFPPATQPMLMQIFEGKSKNQLQRITIVVLSE